MVAKILLVDDDPNILFAMKREFRNRFEVHSAVGAEEGLRMLEECGPFSVVVSDLQMPKMNGIQFLGEVQKRMPEAVRIILTGFASRQLADDAVERGYIFRFHTKPCPLTDLLQSIEEGIEQFERQGLSPGETDVDLENLADRSA